MRFVSLYRPASFGNPSPEMIENMGKLVSEMMASGELVATEGIHPGSKMVRYTRTNGKITVTDGPFTEAKELIGGYAILEVKSMEHLHQVSKRFLEVAGDGECKTYEMYVPPTGK
jgi:hypothetical protein